MLLIIYVNVAKHCDSMLFFKCMFLNIFIERGNQLNGNSGKFFRSCKFADEINPISYEISIESWIVDNRET